MILNALLIILNVFFGKKTYSYTNIALVLLSIELCNISESLM